MKLLYVLLISVIKKLDAGNPRKALVFFFLVVVFSNVSHAKDSIKLITNSPIDKNGPSQNCTVEICTSLLELINQAEKTIDFAIYGLRGQKEILRALINAENKGVIVRGIIDKTLKGYSYYSDTHLLPKNLKNVHDDHSSDIKRAEYLSGFTYNESQQCERPNNTKGPLQCFEGEGYASREKIIFNGDIMHNKFFIVDGKYVWTGSANISDTGIGGYNANIVSYINSSYLAKYYTIEFEQMYLDGNYHKNKKKLKKENISISNDDYDILLFFSPQGRGVSKGIIPLIRQANDSIEVSIFFLTHNKISKELVLAYERGVRVRVILDATAASNGYSKHNYLRKHGIEVKVENWGGKMHMKAAVFDKKHIVVGSMNWTKAGEQKNDENTIIIKNSSKHGMQLFSFFEEMWNSIPAKWLKEDPYPESKESGTSCYDLIDNDFDKIIDSNEKECSY